MLVSLIILSIVLSSVYGVFISTTRAIDTVSAQAELQQTARVILGDLRREIGSIYPLYVPLSEEDMATLDPDTTVPDQGLISFAGEDAEDPDGRASDNLRFTAVIAGANEGGPTRFDIAELVYRIDDDPDTPERGLVREHNDHPGLAIDAEQQIVTEVLTPLATSLQIRYWPGQTVDPETGEVTSSVSEESAAVDMMDEDGWMLSWSDPSMLPAAIEVTLGLTPDEPDAPERQYRMVTTVPIRVPRPDPRDANQRGGQGAGDQTGDQSGAAAETDDAAGGGFAGDGGPGGGGGGGGGGGIAAGGGGAGGGGGGAGGGGGGGARPGGPGGGGGGGGAFGGGGGAGGAGGGGGGAGGGGGNGPR